MIVFLESPPDVMAGTPSARPMTSFSQSPDEEPRVALDLLQTPAAMTASEKVRRSAATTSMRRQRANSLAMAGGIGSGVFAHDECARLQNASRYWNG